MLTRTAARFSSSQPLHVPGAYVRFEVEKERFAKKADLSAVGVAEKRQIEPVIVAVAAAGLEHVGSRSGVWPAKITKSSDLT